MRCHKCGKKTVPMEARVHMAFGDTTVSAITEVGHCDKCNIQSMQFHTRIEPLVKPVQESEVAEMEARGNA